MTDIMLATAAAVVTFYADDEIYVWNLARCWEFGKVYICILFHAHEMRTPEVDKI